MYRREHAQSVVEMALVLPVLLFIIFGIVDMGYYVYGYSTLYQAARNGAQQASMAPPKPSVVRPEVSTSSTGDLCVSNILLKVQEDATLFPDLTKPASGKGPYVEVWYPRVPTSKTTADPGTDSTYKREGEPIEIQIAYPIEPLTPLFKLMNIGTNGKMLVRVTARRSIESLGENPNEADLMACN